MGYPFEEGALICCSARPFKTVVLILKWLRRSWRMHSRTVRLQCMPPATKRRPLRPLRAT